MGFNYLLKNYLNFLFLIRKFNVKVIKPDKITDS